MIVLLIMTMTLVLYYLGLSFITTVAFKKRKIKLSIGLMLFLPLYIIMTYMKVIKAHWHSKKIRKRAISDLLFGYNFPLTILVEVVVFGFENDLIKSHKKVSVLNRISNLKNTSIVNPFANSIEDQLRSA